MLYAPEAFSRLCRTLNQSQLPTKPYGKEFGKTLFKPRRLALKKDAFIDDSQLPYGKFQTRIWANKRRKTSG